MNIRRRDLMKLSATGLLPGVSVPWFETLAVDAAKRPKKSKSCILLWMDGGPSQAHTFDPKNGGEYKTISTSVPGIEVCDCLPQLAKQMDDIALVRGMSTGEGGHYRAKYLLHTICRALDIDHTKEFHPEGDRSMPFVEKGAQPIDELF